MNWNKKKTIEILENLVGKESLQVDASMKERTSFRAGGVAAVLVEPRTPKESVAVVEALHREKAPYVVMGNGSNLLFRDQGYDGVVVVLKYMNHVVTEGNFMVAEPGILLSQLAKEAMEHSLSGLEFASGIPGSLGGAVFMNAGAYGGEMKDLVQRVISFDRNGNMKERQKDELDFGYRHSIFQEEQEVIVGVQLLLQPGNRETIRETMRELLAKRNEKQPVQLPSAGSFFKRPEGQFAGKLIEEAGLKGLCVGGAGVSTQHAGFIVNNGNATATDILDLMVLIQQTVKDQFGVELEPEVQIK